MNAFTTEREKDQLTQKQMADKLDISVNKLRKAEKGVCDLMTACAFCNVYTEYVISEMSIQRRAEQ